jgi:hypothetical protein
MPNIKTTMLRIFITTIFLILSVQSSFGQDSLAIKKSGIYYGLNFGTWFPDSKNKVLGQPPIIGFTIGFNFSKNSYGLNFDLIGWPKGTTTQPIMIKYNDNILTRNEYFGAQVTLEYCRELFDTKYFVLEGMSGLGYGDISYYNPDQYTDIHKASLVFSPGLSIRCIISRTFFIQLKTQYCIANYDLKDNVSTDLRGNYLTTKLIIGGLIN